MVEVADRESLEEWLEGKPHDMATTIAVRAALRVFPFAVIGVIEGEEPKLDLTLTTARALLISSVVPVSPIEDSIWPPSSTFSMFTPPINTSSVEASYSAFSSSIDASSSILASSISVDASTPLGAFSSAAVWPAVSKDLTAFDEGADIKQVLATPLWQDENPFAELWQEKRGYLNAEPVDWSFWINWYQRILDGGAQNWEMLTEIALIDPNDWDKGVAHVNAMIAGIQTLYAVKETIEAAQKVLAEYQAPPAQIGHNNPPEGIEDDPFTAEDAALVKKILDDIGGESESSEPDASRLRTATDGLEAIVRKIGVWLAGKLNMSVDALFKTLGAGAALAVGGPLVDYLKGLLNALQPVIAAVEQWLPFLG